MNAILDWIIKLQIPFYIDLDAEKLWRWYGSFKNVHKTRICPQSP